MKSGGCELHEIEKNTGKILNSKITK